MKYPLFFLGAILFACTMMVAPAHAATAQASEAPSASLAKDSVKSKSNKFTLSGRATGSSFVFVALVPSTYAGPTDWHKIYTNDDYVAFTGEAITKVRHGKWKTSFMGVPSGTYTALIYDNSNAQTLLGTSQLVVSANDTLKFKAKSHKAFVLGVGQSASDGGVQVTLSSVAYSNGLTGTPTASFNVDVKGYDSAVYSGTIGDVLPQGGGISDSKVSGGGIGIELSDISVSMNAVILKIRVIRKG